MNRRMAAAAIVAAFLMLGFAPAIGTDALEPKDFSISIPGTNAPDTPIVVEMVNGQSESWSVYVVNTSEKYLDVAFHVTGQSEDIQVTSVPEDTLIGPVGTTFTHIANGTFALNISHTSDSYKQHPVVMTVYVSDISDKSSTVATEVKFIIDVDSSYSTADQYNKFFGIFPNNLPEPLNGTWFTVLVTILVLISLTFVVSRILVPFILKKIGDKYLGGEPESLSKTIEAMLTILAAIIGLLLSMRIVGASTESVASVQRISTVIYTALVIVAVWKVYLYVIKTLLERVDSKDEFGVDITLMPLLKMIGKILFWIIGATIILGAFGVDLQGILVSAGIISLGITLGAQNVLSQFFSGMVLLTTRPFIKGDFVKYNGEVYIVRTVKIMFTEFYNWDKDQVITVPNNVLTSNTISNLSKGASGNRLFVYVDVAYDADLKKAEEIMLDVANRSKHLTTKLGKPNVRLTEFGKSGIVLRLGCYVIDYDCTSEAASWMRSEIYKAFLENGIEIPYDKVEIFLKTPCDGKKMPSDTTED